jgi:beta-fructofuranosidase
VIDRSETSAAADTTTGIDASPESGRLRLFDINDRCGAQGGNGGHGGHPGLDGLDGLNAVGGGFGHKGEHGSSGSKPNTAWGSNAQTSEFGEVGEDRIETLSLTIVVDNSVLEVYANNRFVVSTWVRYVSLIHLFLLFTERKLILWQSLVRKLD